MRRVLSLSFALKNIVRKFSSEVLEKKNRITQLTKLFLEEENKYGLLPFFKKSLLYDDQIAIKDTSGEYTYITLYVSAKKLAWQISNICGSASCSNVAYMCSNNVLSPIIQWACWISGQTALPLFSTYSLPLLNHITTNSKARMIISTPEFEEIARQVAAKQDLVLLIVDRSFIPTKTILEDTEKIFITAGEQVIIEGALNNDFYDKANALILYNFNTQSPQILEMTHKNLNDQIKYCMKTWKYTTTDTLLNVIPYKSLPSNIDMMSILNVGGKVIMQDELNILQLWNEILREDNSSKVNANVLIAAPTTYKFLISTYNQMLAQNVDWKQFIKNQCKNKFRLMISDFDVLPDEILHSWHSISKHKLYERYSAIETNGILVDSSSQQTNSKEISKHSDANERVENKLEECDNNTNDLIVSNKELQT